MTPPPQPQRQRRWNLNPFGALSGTALESRSAMSRPHHGQWEKLSETTQPQFNPSVGLQPQRVKGRGAEVPDLRGQVVRQALREHVLDALPLAVLLVPFRLVGGDALLRCLRLAERHLDDR